MKLKYYLRGLGNGIIFTVIILAIIHSYETTDSKIIERAKELGMVMPKETTLEEEDTTLNTLSEEKTTEPDTKEQKETESVTKETAATGQKDTEKKTSEQETPEIATTEPSTTEDLTTEPSTDNNEVLFTIKSGMTSESVSQNLKELGIISDAEEFNRFLISSGYADRIKVGTFTIKKGSSYEQIAAIISGN